MRESIQTIILILCFIAICIWLWKQLHKKVEWYSQHIIPENPRKDRNISEDVLVYDYDNDCNLMAYYRYGQPNDNWVFMGNEEIPKNFKWRYFDIDIDEP